jgi:hypothetical protein
MTNAATTATDLDAIKDKLGDYHDADRHGDTEAVDGLANELVMDLPALIAELAKLREAVDSVLADADHNYYEMFGGGDWWLRRLAAARS